MVWQSALGLTSFVKQLKRTIGGMFNVTPDNKDKKVDYSEDENTERGNWSGQ